jgi:hypothetical protein
MIRTTWFLLASALLAACGSGEPEDTARGAAPDSAAAAPAAAPPAVDTARAPAEAQTPTLVLASDGLEIAAEGGAPARLPFGTPRARVLADVGAVLGAPQRQGDLEECPAGPLAHAEYGAGLQVVFQDGAFVGWSTRPGSTLRTAAGIGPGSTLRQLRTAYPAMTMEETSLGHEFAAGELFGVVADTSDAGQVEALLAGINCIFR